LEPRPGQTYFQRPALTIFFSMIGVVIVGTGLLMLPFINSEPGGASFLTALFTSASAVTTTGLSLEVTATYWNGIGQGIIAVLIFVGGLGFMTGVTFLFILIGHRLSLSEHLVLREQLAMQPLGGLVRLARNVFLLDVAITGAGILPLWFAFNRYYDAPEALWQATFHSVSAFNTAGFDIVGPASLAPFPADYFLLSVLTVIAILGAISYTVLLELGGGRLWRRLSLDTKMVLLVSVGLWSIGSALAAAFALWEHALPFDGPAGAEIFTAFFNTVSGATTTGFSTIDFSQVQDSVLVVTIGLMFIGGASGSTAGGIKVGTIAVLMIAVCSFLRGRRHAEAFDREIPFLQINRALTITAVGVAIVGVSLLMLQFIEPDIPAVPLLFEALSAWGTVGLSAGVLPQLSVPGISVIIMLMLIGRLGVLSLIVLVAPGEQPSRYRYPKESVRIG
jgi:trk system potassium uptake protein TrkH